jgi:hypothetical protein
MRIVKIISLSAVLIISLGFFYFFSENELLNFIRPLSEKIGVNFTKRAINQTDDNAPIKDSLSKEEKAALCLKEISQKDDEGLIQSIITIANPAQPIPEAGNEEKRAYVRKLLIRYLGCKTAVSGDEKFYKLCEDFILSENIDEKIKKEMILQLSNRLDGTATISLPSLIALGDINRICPEQLPAQCLKDSEAYYSEFTGLKEKCEKICDSLNEYGVNKQLLDEEIIYFRNWHNSAPVRENQYKLRVGIAYRFGGQELAREVCRQALDGETEKCLAALNFSGCYDYRAKIEELICRY